ncbi:M60 family metallopeptidase [uncultured Bacteroides sp.]|uniref:M60 family metallopeptidase n=1 Tax=uncultured Bacteroides sp. TaxID=162156 RepID=UPI0025E446F0|nr:M60 family metallopeptidase [uncultured Bacteroides sp.]
MYCVLAISCSSDDEELVGVDLSVNKEVVDFTMEAGTQSITVVTNAPTWDAKADKGWCTLSVAGKILKISVDESTERLVREAIVTITTDSQVKTVKVRQLGWEAAILTDPSAFEVEVVGSEITLNVTTNVEVKTEFPEWITEKGRTRAPEMVTSTHTYVVKRSVLDAKREGTITFTEVLPEGATEEDIPVSATVLVSQHGLNEYNAGNGEDIKDDIKIKVVGGTDTSHQGDDGIEKSFDCDYSTLYHSNWTNSGSNYFPITLTYNFAEASDVDYLIYYPRSEGNNGRFKEVEIQYSSDGNSFTKLMDKDFQGSATATRVTFDETLRAKSFRFIVKSGAGDGQGFASCAEMEFYTKNLDTFDYKTLFEDEICSKLKTGITETDIENCKYPFFKNLAYYMLQGKYDDAFRVANYKAYPNPDIQSETHKTNPYSLLDNPTGISVEKDETLVVLVGDTYNQNIGLKVQNLDAPNSDGFGGPTYPLNRGINKLKMSEKGLVYVTYYTRELDNPTAQPIGIHIASGTVNGYYDSQNEDHKGRWSELLGKATDKYFDVLGKYAHLTFETSDFRRYASSNGNELIDLYDKIVYSEMELLGLVKYNKEFRNRMYLNVMYQSYMYATAYHTAYNQTTMADVCDPTKLKTTACWGPAHEIGHCNQTRPGLKWIGTTEVTNNIMSQYIQTTIFGQDSRIQTEDMGATYRNRYSKAWSSIIVPGAPHSQFTSGPKDEDDVFCKLVPFWQLELYFGKVLGRTPLQQSDKGGFYPEVYEAVRQKDYAGMSNGEIQLDFVYTCCVVAKTNLLDFFEKWGFLAEVDRQIEDYSTEPMKVTKAMADALRTKVENLEYPKPDVALEYISDNSWEWYKTKPSIVAGDNAVRSGNTLTIRNWQYVVAYEVTDASNNLVFISSGETTPSTTDTFTISGSWKDGYKLYAVSVTGERKEISIGN